LRSKQKNTPDEGTSGGLNFKVRHYRLLEQDDFVFESSSRSIALFEHVLFRKTGSHPRVKPVNPEGRLFAGHALAAEEIIESRHEAVAAQSDAITFAGSCNRCASGGPVDVVASAEIGVHELKTE
jgi:hypothetical protein